MYHLPHTIRITGGDEYLVDESLMDIMRKLHAAKRSGMPAKFVSASVRWHEGLPEARPSEEIAVAPQAVLAIAPDLAFDFSMVLNTAEAIVTARREGRHGLAAILAADHTYIAAYSRHFGL